MHRLLPALALLLAACHAAPIAPTRAARIELLQRAVATGLDAGWSDRCFAPMAWAVLDEAVGGERLDALLAPGTEPQPPRCSALVGEARLLRRIRLGTVDLASELAHPAPEARSAAL
ncbi:MAG: hypothetical protein ACK4N5_20060, partial [Myxococcales bacterium]